ncbi:MAG: glutaredoxin family protein, partial [Candidatus Heimdallarchaeota archaeon]|nr:glutaredoxin family protein [Candidatus Heimdallarchaeota archaeon]
MVKVTKFYGTSWCSDCKISKSFLNEHLIDYDYIDITEDEEATKIVKKINDGKR